MDLNILNKEEIDTWCFNHVVTQGHIVDGIKGSIKGSNDSFNVAWVDRHTGESISVIFCEA